MCVSTCSQSLFGYSPDRGAMQIPIGCNRKPGRPKTTAGALQEQDIEYACSDTESEDEAAQPLPAKTKAKKKVTKKRAPESPDEAESDHDLFNTASAPNPKKVRAPTTADSQQASAPKVKVTKSKKTTSTALPALSVPTKKAIISLAPADAAVAVKPTRSTKKSKIASAASTRAAILAEPLTTKKTVSTLPTASEITPVTRQLRAKRIIN